MVSSTQTNAMKRILIRDLLRKSIRLDHLIAKQSRNPTREIGKFRRILPPGERSKHDFTCLRDLIRYTIRLTSYGDPKDSPDMFNEGFRALRLLEDRVGFFEKTSDSQKPELINLDRNRTCFPLSRLTILASPQLAKYFVTGKKDSAGLSFSGSQPVQAAKHGFEMLGLKTGPTRRFTGFSWTLKTSRNRT
mmetsp:Transcript_38058/g.73715  ORF Transcript_38058/g.73715 Transcript_38058/m.73715 type:complete len:191 (+) Transcript_38058:76-648(+)